MVVATASQVKNAFGKYLDIVLSEGEVQITRNNRPIAKIVSLKNVDNEVPANVENSIEQDG